MGIIGDLIGGASSSSASKKAAKAQVEAARIAADTQRGMFNDIVSLQGPQLQAGATATNRYLQLMGLTPAQPTNAMAGGGDAAARIAWLQQNTGTDTPAMIQQYLAANSGMSPEQQLAGIMAAGLGPNDTQKYQDYSGTQTSGANIPNYQLSVDPNAADFGKYAKDFSMADFEQDPGYAFRFDEGLKALQRAMGAKGQFMSGSMIKGSQRYGQDMASQEYTNAFNRYQINRSNQLNPLENLMGMGQSSVNQLSGAAQNTGNNIAELQTQQGNARASGYIGSANAWNNALSNVNKTITGGILLGGLL